MGTAMAHALALGGSRTALWDHFPEVVRSARETGENLRFLPGVRLHHGVSPNDDLGDCLAGAQLVVVCVPSTFVLSVMEKAAPFLRHGTLVLNASKGFAPGTSHPLLDAIAERHPTLRAAQLAGPALADEFARGIPASVVVASTDGPAAQSIARLIDGPAFVPVITSDLQGALLGGILKNIYAIFLGCLGSLCGTGRNLESAAITTCLAEMAAIAMAGGAQRSTLYGLAGLGDLVATGLSDASHNRALGKMLAAGKTIPEIRDAQGWLPEGASAAPVADILARDAGVAAPLAHWVTDTLNGTAPSPEGALAALRDAATLDRR